MTGSTVLAAGGVLWRGDPLDPEVALVHRPKYDDWSLPKGKAKPGEHLLVTALREVNEETGYQPRIGPYLTTLQYRVYSGGNSSNKVVTYWSMRNVGGSFQRNSEVDRMLWLSVGEAYARLTTPSDRTVLDAFGLASRDTGTLLLLRHGETAARADRKKRKPEGRPLNRLGKVQATSLVPVLERLGITDLLSSDHPACVETLAPFAATTGLRVRRDAQLTRVGFEANESAVIDSVRSAAIAHEGLVFCGGKTVIKGLLTSLAYGPDVVAPQEPTIKKGGWWLLHHRAGVVSAYEKHEPIA